MESRRAGAAPAFCIACGEPADGTVTLHCRRCGHTHYLNSKVSASTLTVSGDTYLAVQRATEPDLGCWDLPGGFCEYGEHPADTARRETFEESGLDVVIDDLLGLWMDTYPEPDGWPWPTVNLVYSAHLADPTGRADDATLDVTEISAVRWVSLTTPPPDLAFATQQLGAIAAFTKSR